MSVQKKMLFLNPHQDLRNQYPSIMDVPRSLRKIGFTEINCISQCSNQLNKIHCFLPVNLNHYWLIWYKNLQPYFINTHLLQSYSGAHSREDAGFHHDDVIDGDLLLRARHVHHRKQPAAVLRVYIGVHRCLNVCRDRNKNHINTNTSIYMWYQLKAGRKYTSRQLINTVPSNAIQWIEIHVQSNRQHEWKQIHTGTCKNIPSKQTLVASPSFGVRRLIMKPNWEIFTLWLFQITCLWYCNIFNFFCSVGKKISLQWKNDLTFQNNK